MNRQIDDDLIRLSHLDLNSRWGPHDHGIARLRLVLGFRPGKPMAIVAGASEAGAGLLLALGLHGFAGNVWGLIAVATSVVSGLAVAHGEWNRRAR